MGYEGQSQYSHPQNFIDQNEIHSLTQPSSNLFLSTSIQPGHIPLKNGFVLVYFSILFNKFIFKSDYYIYKFIKGFLFNKIFNFSIFIDSFRNFI